MQQWLIGLARRGRLLAGAVALAAVIVMLGGIAVGAAWERATAGAQPPPGQPGHDLPLGPAPARGLAGEIWLVDPRGILVRDLAGRLRPVRVTPRTIIRLPRGDRLTLDLLRQGDRVVVLGQRTPRGVFMARFVIVAQRSRAAVDGAPLRPGLSPPALFPDEVPDGRPPAPPARPRLVHGASGSAARAG